MVGTKYSGACSQLGVQVALVGAACLERLTFLSIVSGMLSSLSLVLYYTPPFQGDRLRSSDKEGERGVVRCGCSL